LLRSRRVDPALGQRGQLLVGGFLLAQRMLQQVGDDAMPDDRAGVRTAP
jgi:hypothetical protein